MCNADGKCRNRSKQLTEDLVVPCLRGLSYKQVQTICCICISMASEQDKDNKISNLKLYSYWMSSCSFRVRIALNLKGLKYEYKAVTPLYKSHPDYLKLNPLGLVPVLVDGDLVLAESLAIIMYLEDKYPQHPLLPHDIHKRAINFQAAHIVSSSIQPLQNLGFLYYIGEKVGPDEKLPWAQSVIRKGFTALEKLLIDHTGRYATGDEVFLYDLNIIDSKVSDHKLLKINRTRHRNRLWADLFLAPQLYSAFKTFNISMNEFPILSRLHETYNGIPAFEEALPENQPDAVH